MAFAAVRNPDRFGDVGHGQRGDEVRAGTGQRRNLTPVIVLRFGGRHDVARVISVAAGADAAADDARHVAIIGLERTSPLHRLSIEVVELLLSEAELGRPVRARAPACSDELEAGAEAPSQVQVRPDIVVQRLLTFGGPQQHHRCEERQVDTAVEDQVGLDPAIGQEEAIELRE